MVLGKSKRVLDAAVIEKRSGLIIAEEIVVAIKCGWYRPRLATEIVVADGPGLAK